MNIEEKIKETTIKEKQFEESVNNNPSFEYVIDVSKKQLSKLLSDAHLLFAIRLDRLDCIDTSRKKKYLTTTEVQDTLRAFHLDSEKFWYLCLFLKDVMEGYAEGIETVSPSTEIYNLIELFRKIEFLHSDDNDEYNILKSNAILSLKVGNKSIQINDPFTLLRIRTALMPLLEDEHFDSFYYSDIKYAHKKPTFKIALFNMLLKSYLEDKKADKAIVINSSGKKISKDKSLLVSRMIFVLGISDDESFFEEYKEDGSKLNYLKNYTKKYKMGMEVPTLNIYYSYIDPISISFVHKRRG